MDKPKLDHDFFEMIKREHSELIDMMAHVRRALASDIRDPGGVNQLIGFGTAPSSETFVEGGGSSTVVVEDTATSTEDAGKTTSHTVSLPSNISLGDLLIVVFSLGGGNGGTVSWPGGWTEIAEIDNSGSIKLAVAYRQADGDEDPTITVTSTEQERSSHTSYRITGHDDPATQAPELSTGATGDSTAPDPDSLTPTGGSKAYLWLAVHAHSQIVTTSGFPTNYSNGISAQGASAGTGVGSAERELTGSSEDPGVFTISGTVKWAAATVAVHPQ